MATESPTHKVKELVGEWGLIIVLGIAAAGVALLKDNPEDSSSDRLPSAHPTLMIPEKLEMSTPIPEY